MNKGESLFGRDGPINMIIQYVYDEGASKPALYQPNEECHTAKGKQTCSSVEICPFFYLAAKNVTTHTI